MLPYPATLCCDPAGYPAVVGGRRRNPGKISDYDPGVDQFNSPYSGKTQANIVYDSNTGEVQNPGRRQPGSIANYDPLNQQFGSVAGDPRGYQQHPEPVRQPAYQPPPPQPQPPRSKGMMCKAMYDYTAADSDEVSFIDGDVIIECQPVDAGWMTGRVERTGQYGMLPSNYVERIN
ncbi:hypothetical protein BaRGS_00031705 [Batillaria attramentaria]|uniref:SH3 domain-containing protein n=1 Tax=Batillaria attramentaria TaxID=370345 RepID=A0ABD0JIH5_9CAEN